MVIKSKKKWGAIKLHTGKKNINKAVIIKVTLELIEEKGGIKDVNLRLIARRIGCAHTNLYNYYESLDEILWEALGQALTEMMSYSDKEFGEDCEFYSLISKHIEFSMKHPGWYRLIWLEDIGGEPSEEIAEILRKPGEKFVKEVMKARSDELAQEEAGIIADIIHGYLHGALCKWINKRTPSCTKLEAEETILTNVKKILEMKV